MNDYIPDYNDAFTIDNTAIAAVEFDINISVGKAVIVF
jgi:hypothetical protein